MKHASKILLCTALGAGLASSANTIGFDPEQLIRGLQQQVRALTEAQPRPLPPGEAQHGAPSRPGSTTFSHDELAADEGEGGAAPSPLAEGGEQHPAPAHRAGFGRAERPQWAHVSGAGRGAPGGHMPGLPGMANPPADAVPPPALGYQPPAEPGDALPPEEDPRQPGEGGSQGPHGDDCPPGEHPQHKPVASVPEPMSFGLLGAGILALGLSRRRR